MEGGLPMLTCLLQHTLRSLCTCSSEDSSDNSSKWVYAVFWRILPRNYPPPKWDHGGSILDRAKGNKRNWILVWEDGYCDFDECERGYIKGRFGADVFFKLSHEVYNYGEGLMGKVAADNSHKGVFRDGPNENDPTFISSWNISIDPQPRAWEFQFNSGIQTIAIISVREGIIQLGSFDKIVEDLNLLISIQRKFSYLQSIPGIYTIQRPFFPIQQQHQPAPFAIDKSHVIGSKRGDRPDNPGSIKSINLGYNTPQNGLIGSNPPPVWSIPPLLPPISCSFGAPLTKLPSSNNDTTINPDPNNGNRNNKGIIRQCVGVENCGLAENEIGDRALEIFRALESGREEKPSCLNPNSGLVNGDGSRVYRAHEGGINLRRPTREDFI